MSRFPIRVLLILSLSGGACAQAYASPPSDAPMPAASEPAQVAELDLVAMAARKPSLEPVMRAMIRSNLSKADAEIELDYTAAGDVTAVRLVKTSTVGEIDRAILAWAEKLKFKPGVAGTGRLPFKLKSG